MTRTSAAGGIPAVVTYGVLNDPAGKSQCELDIVASEPDGTVLAIGEAKSGETLVHKHLTRLRHATELLRARDRVATDAQPVLLLFGGAGFTAELTASAAGSDGKIQLIGLDHLYGGSLSTFTASCHWVPMPFGPGISATLSTAPLLADATTSSKPVSAGAGAVIRCVIFSVCHGNGVPEKAPEHRRLASPSSADRLPADYKPALRDLPMRPGLGYL